MGGEVVRGRTYDGKVFFSSTPTKYRCYRPKSPLQNLKKRPPDAWLKPREKWKDVPAGYSAVCSRRDLTRNLTRTCPCFPGHRGQVVAHRVRSVCGVCRGGCQSESVGVKCWLKSSGEKSRFCERRWTCRNTECACLWSVRPVRRAQFDYQAKHSVSALPSRW